MKIMMRKKGEKRWKSYEKSYILRENAETFAEERSLEDGDIVEIKDNGEYKISIIALPEYYGERL